MKRQMLRIMGTGMFVKKTVHRGRFMLSFFHQVVPALSCVVSLLASFARSMRPGIFCACGLTKQAYFAILASKVWTYLVWD